MNKIKELLKKEFIIGMKPFDWAFLGIGLLIQVVGIIVSICLNEPNIVLSAVCSIAGCISVVLCSRGKLSQYFFGYIQLIPYLILAMGAGLSGEVVENWFYAITMVVGIVIWIKKYKTHDTQEITVETKNMTVLNWIITGVITVGLCFLVGLFLAKVPEFSVWLTGSANPEPWLDSITTVVPLIGQVLMCLRYSDQWIFWFVEDVISIIMWAILGNWLMVSMYIFWTANTVYGWIIWRKLANEK